MIHRLGVAASRPALSLSAQHLPLATAMMAASRCCSAATLGLTRRHFVSPSIPVSSATALRPHSMSPRRHVHPPVAVGRPRPPSLLQRRLFTAEAHRRQGLHQNKQPQTRSSGPSGETTSPRAEDAAKPSPSSAPASQPLADASSASSASSTSPSSTSSESPTKEPSSSASSSLLARENVYTIPNLLTASRLVVAPFLGYAIVHDLHSLTLALFAWAGVSDLLDGWIARRWGQGTVVGTVIDPMADKTLMLVLTVSLAVKGALPPWLAVLIIGRDVGLGISAIYYRWISLPPPKTFTRYWDFSLPSAEVRPTTISKYNTFLQLALMGLTIIAPVAPLDLGSALTVMQYVVAATTVWSGASYVFSKDAVRILSQAKKTDKNNKMMK